MSFPKDDTPWAETAAFLAAHLAPEERLLAPAPFRQIFPLAAAPVQARGRLPSEFDWVATHKGELGAMPRALLEGVAAQFAPVFANPVFVVWCASPPLGLPDLSATDHVRAFHVNLAALPPERAEDLLPEPEEPSLPPGPAWTPPPARREAAREVSARWWLGVGGRPGGLRARAFLEETDRLVQDALAPAGGERVLGIGGAEGRLAVLLPGAEAVLSLDPAAAFARLPAEDAAFDTVVLLDALPELPDVPAALAEAARVLRRGGRLWLSAPNRESLAMRALQRLGLPLPGPAFSLSAITGMLRAAGLHAVRTDGIMLSPGWAIPGVDRGLGPLEEDPEFVEAERLLGRRAGPDYALAFAVLARKG
jgi:SAM-dependent methyltransferase